MQITLYRYLVKEQIVPFFVCLLGVSVILLTGRLLQLLRYLFTSSSTVLDLLQLIAFALPKLMLFALPMAALLGVLLAFVRLNADNEIIALRAAGIGFYQFLPPVAFMLLGVTLVSFLNMVYVIPPSSIAFEYKIRNMARSSLPVLMQEGTFITAIPKLVFFFQSVNPNELSIRGIFVQDQRQADVRLAIVAAHGQIAYQRDLNHLTFKLSNGIITRVSDDVKNAQSIEFKSYDLTFPLDELLGTADKYSKSKREMTLRELFRSVRDKSEDIGFQIEFYQRLAFPSGCLLLGLIGAPLGAISRQRGRMTGVTIGLCVFLVYYVILSAGKGLGENHMVGPFIASWAPNFLCTIVAVYLWRKIHHETPFKALAFLQHKIAGLAALRKVCRLKQP